MSNDTRLYLSLIDFSEVSDGEQVFSGKEHWLQTNVMYNEQTLS